MVRQQWYISDSRMVNVALPFDDLERAIWWKDYLARIRPEYAPHIIHGVIIDENSKLIEMAKLHEKKEEKQ